VETGFRQKNGSMIFPSNWVLAVSMTVMLCDPAIAGDEIFTQSGVASIYSQKGGKTASGEATNPENLTAAHRSLPFGTMVHVTNPKNDRSVVVRINDRGPFTRGRVIDLTPAAARQLGFSGVTAVNLEGADR
jgi:rare lipoprotein A